VGLWVKISPRSFGWNLHNVVSAFADVLIPHAHRWEELHLFHIDHTQAAEQAFDKFKSLNLPRLERLVLWSREWDATDKICSTWTLPNLRRIIVHNGVPMELPGKANLLECDVVLEGCNIKGFIPKISDFLGSLTSLTTLQRTSSEATFLHSYDLKNLIRLPNLRTLSMRLTFRKHDDMFNAQRSGQGILSLFEHLEAPQLGELSVKLDKTDD
jgi:hypothetical protein